MNHPDFIRKIYDLVSNDQDLSSKFHDFEHNWFDHLGIEKSNITQNMCFLSFIFEYEIDKRLTLDLITTNFKDQFTTEESDYLKSISKNIYSAFEVTDITQGESITFTDLQSDKSYTVKETNQLSVEPGMIIFSRISEIEGKYQIIQLDGISPASIAYIIKRSLLENSQPLKSASVGPMLYPAKKHDHDHEHDHEERTNPEKRLKKYLLKYLGKKFKWSEITKLAEAEDKEAAVSAFMKKYATIFPETDHEAIKQTLINFATRKPEAGPQESGIVNQHFRELQTHYGEDIKKENYPSDEDIRKFQEKWFNTAQKELNNRTPIEAIKEEREYLKNDNPEIIPTFSYKNLQQHNKLQKDYQKAAALINDQKIKEAIEVLEELASSNPEASPILFQLANCYLDVGHKERDNTSLDRAVQLYNKVLGLEPQNESAAKNLQLAQMLKGRTEFMKYEDEIDKLDAKQLDTEIKKYIPDFSPEDFDKRAATSISAYEVFQSYTNDQKIIGETPQKAEVALKVYWLHNKKAGFDFYDLEKFVSDKLSNFNFQNTEESQKELTSNLEELKKLLDPLDVNYRAKLTQAFLQSFAYEFICRTLPERIIASKNWEDKRLDLFDLLYEIFRRPEFIRQKGAVLISEDKVEDGIRILENLETEGDSQAKLVLAQALYSQKDPAHKQQGQKIAEEISKNYVQYNLSQDQAKDFLKSFK